MQCVVRRLQDELSLVPEHIQESQEAERQKQGKPPRATSLSDFLGAGYLMLLAKVIKANLDQFADMFQSNG